MAILGKDVFPIHELSQHDKELQFILSSLESIGRKMSENRADDMEILLYQTYLIYMATLGGCIGIEPHDDPRQPAFDAVDSLWRFTSDEEDIFPEEEEIFHTPQFTPETYLEAFHILLSESYFHRVDSAPQGGLVMPYDEIDLIDESLTEESIRYYHAVRLFFEPYIKKAGSRILDKDARHLPPEYSFDGIEQYTICEQDKNLEAFFILRKEMEGEAWNNVEIVSKTDESIGVFDCILLGSSFSKYGDSLEGFNDYTTLMREGGHIILNCDCLNTRLSRELVESGMLNMVVSMDIPGGYSRYLYFLHNNSYDAVTFIALGEDEKTNDRLESYTVCTVSNIDSERIILVPYQDLIPTNLIPGYYLLVRESRNEGAIPLKNYMSKSVSRETKINGKDLVNEDVVQRISTDTRLLETKPEKPLDPEGYNYYYVTESSVLMNTSRREIGFIELNNGQKILVGIRFLAFPVNTAKVDIRYLVLSLRKNSLIRVATQYVTSFDDLLEIYIPELSLNEQAQEVDTYLKEVRNEFNSKININDSTLQLLVFTPNKDGFETINKEKLDKLGFRVLKYVEDKSSLKEALSEHYGEKVLSSELADAVLVCADMPANDVEKAIYFIEKTGIRVFYYSDSPSYDFDKIDEDYLDDFKKGFISDKDYLERIREKMDADSNKVRDQYSKFFKAADRLDEDYGWGLAEYATSLLQGKPFKMDINKLRSKIDETIITFFKSHHIAPAEMDNTAVASLVADKKYYEGRKKVNINLTEELSKTALDAEAWYKYALVAIRKLGNKDSHSSSDSDSSLELAAFTLFTEIIVWLDSVRERYKEKKCLFVIKKGNVELPFYTVEEYQVDGKDYLVANGVHLIDTKRELKAGDQVVILDTEAEKYPRTINGSRVEEVASPTNYIVAIKA